MFMKILKFIIIIFIVMCVVGLLRGKGRTKARGSETVKEARRIDSFSEKIRKYEADPENSGITEDEYIYSCYMAEKPYKGIDLKKAVAFQTTCETRGVYSTDGMKNILKMGELFGGLGDTMDVNEIYVLGERVSNLAANRRRTEKAEQ